MSDERAKAMIAALLSTEGRTEDEVAAARLHAVRLMLKHGLTEEEVLASRPDMARSDTALGRYDWIVAKWIAKLVGDLCGVEPWFESKRGTGRTGRTDLKAYCYAGYRPDVEQAEWLLRTILDTAKAGSKAFKGDRPKGDYLAAFASTVARRLREMIAGLETARAETPTGTDLVVVKMARVGEYVSKELGITLRDSRTRGRSLQDAHAAIRGREDGSTVSLARPVGSEGGPLRIGRG